MYYTSADILRRRPSFDSGHTLSCNGAQPCFCGRISYDDLDDRLESLRPRHIKSFSEDTRYVMPPLRDKERKVSTEPDMELERRDAGADRDRRLDKTIDDYHPRSERPKERRRSESSTRPSPLEWTPPRAPKDWFGLESRDYKDPWEPDRRDLGVKPRKKEEKRIVDKDERSRDKRASLDLNATHDVRYLAGIPKLTPRAPRATPVALPSTKRDDKERKPQPTQATDTRRHDKPLSNGTASVRPSVQPRLAESPRASAATAKQSVSAQAAPPHVSKSHKVQPTPRSQPTPIPSRGSPQDQREWQSASSPREWHSSDRHYAGVAHSAPEARMYAPSSEYRDHAPEPVKPGKSNKIVASAGSVPDIQRETHSAAPLAAPPPVRARTPPLGTRPRSPFRIATCPIAGGIPLTDLRAFSTTPAALKAETETLASLLRDLQGTKRWEDWCGDLQVKLADHRVEEKKLRMALDKIIPLGSLVPWEKWVSEQLQSPNPSTSRDHLREEKEYVRFLAGIDKHVRRYAEIRRMCEVELGRLRRLGGRS